MAKRVTLMLLLSLATPAHSSDRLEDYIATVAPASATQIATDLRAATAHAFEEFGATVEPERLATYARWESWFVPDAVGAAGEHGLLQIHPCHTKSMAELGLDFENLADCLVFGALLYSWHGDQPWRATRTRARRDYRKWFEGES